jgi:hypothetical protein
MITPKLIELHKKANQPGIFVWEAQKISRDFFDELFENCAPTMQEFDTYAQGVIPTGGDLWRLIQYVSSGSSVEVK